MKLFEVLEHTADLRLKVFGRTEEELFQNGALALSSILKKETKKGPPADFVKIKAEGKDLKELLVNFLNEILAKSQIDRKIYRRVKFLKFSGTVLEAQIFGAPVDRFDEDVKAVTHHGVNIKKNKRGIFETILVLDI